jgi:hypothetical protein
MARPGVEFEREQPGWISSVCYTYVINMFTFDITCTAYLLLSLCAMDRITCTAHLLLPVCAKTAV